MKTNEAKVMNELHKAGMAYDEAWELMKELMTVRRLAKKHHRLAEMACNGEGFIRGQFYSCDSDRGNTAMITTDPDVYVWDVESDKVEAKIKAIADRIGLRVEFQGDPRGYTVKVFKGDRFLDIQA